MGQPMLPTTSVDVGHLDQAAVQLDDIARFLETYCLNQLYTFSDALGSPTNVHNSGANYQFTKNATYFGGFHSAYNLQERADSAYRSIEDSLKGLIDRLNKAADATRQIAANYRTVEERNKAMGQDIERVLDNYQLSAPGATPLA